MSTLRRIRPALFVLGVALAVGSAVGARALTAGSHPTEGSKSANGTPTANSKVGGPIVLGTVDSNPSPVAYGLPSVLQSGTVTKVFVKEGQDVADKAPLYEFDSSIQKRDLERAEIAILQAKNEVAKAAEAKKQHLEKIKVMKQTVNAAEQKVKSTGRAYNVMKTNIKEGLKNSNPDASEAAIQEKLDKNPDLLKVNIDWVDADSLYKRLQAELEALELADIDLLVKQANIAVDQATAEKAKAQTALDLCTVYAKGPGTIEQVKISPGTTLGISTRDPALWLIPAGSRIIRCEVEADFAHRVTASLKGKEVVIHDHTNPDITYKGVVDRIGGTFLPKRSESLIPSDTRVLECIVEVPDASPSGKPPLRVGQRVRVNLGN